MTHIIMCNVLVWFGFILKSCLSVFATLQKRLSEALEAVDEGLDPTLTGDLRVHGLCRVLWLVTRQKPNVQICRLRVDDYAELNTRLRKVHQKILSISSDVQAALSALKNELLLTEEFVSALAETQGFEETWLYEVEAKVSRGRGPKAVAAAKAADIANNQRLPDMIRQRLPGWSSASCGSSFASSTCTSSARTTGKSTCSGCSGCSCASRWDCGTSRQSTTTSSTRCSGCACAVVASCSGASSCAASASSAQWPCGSRRCAL